MFYLFSIYIKVRASVMVLLVSRLQSYEINVKRRYFEATNIC